MRGRIDTRRKIDSLIAEIDDIATKAGMTRSDTLRWLYNKACDEGLIPKDRIDRFGNKLYTGGN